MLKSSRKITINSSYIASTTAVDGLMMTSSNGNNFRVTGLLTGGFTGDRRSPLTKASDAELWYFLCSAHWINGWVNNRVTGDLWRHRTHHDVIVIFHTKIHVSLQRFSNLASDWLGTVLPANPMPVYKIFVSTIMELTWILLSNPGLWWRRVLGYSDNQGLAMCIYKIHIFKDTIV